MRSICYHLNAIFRLDSVRQKFQSNEVRMPNKQGKEVQFPNRTYVSILSQTVITNIILRGCKPPLT